MQKLIGIFGNVVWTSIFALIGGYIALVAGISGASTEAVLGLGIYSVVMAILSPRR